MTWNPTCPNGGLSVQDNRSIIQANMEYINTTMKVDHFWNDATAQNSGHHRFVQAQASNIATPTSLVDPTIATGMNGVFYDRFKTPSENVSNGGSPPINLLDCAPYFLNQTLSLQLLGISVAAVFNVDISSSAISVLYFHNLLSPIGIVRTGTGNYIATFQNALPSSNYMFFGAGVNKNIGSNNLVNVFVSGNSNPANEKFTNKVNFSVSGGNGLTDPSQAWFICFGG